MNIILVWIVVAVAGVLLAGLVTWQHFYPPAGFKIPNKIIANMPKGIQRTRIIQHPGLSISSLKMIKKELANLTRDKNLSANPRINPS